MKTKAGRPTKYRKEYPELLESVLSKGLFNQTFCAENAQQALNILDDEAIDLMLCDIVMPEMDGYQLAAIVKEKYPHVKIQLASGFSDNRHIDMVDESLQKNILLKPFNSQALLQGIKALLSEE